LAKDYGNFFKKESKGKIWRICVHSYTLMSNNYAPIGKSTYIHKKGNIYSDISLWQRKISIMLTSIIQKYFVNTDDMKIMTKYCFFKFQFNKTKNFRNYNTAFLAKYQEIELRRKLNYLKLVRQYYCYSSRIYTSNLRG